MVRTFFIVFFTLLLAVQVGASVPTPIAYAQITPASNGAEKIFSFDRESKICFIDFSQIDGYAKQVVVTDETGKAVFKSELWELPETTIYELSYKDYNTGKYKVELFTYSTAFSTPLVVE
jgi:hypothetical protein